MLCSGSESLNHWSTKAVLVFSLLCVCLTQQLGAPDPGGGFPWTGRVHERKFRTGWEAVLLTFIFLFYHGVWKIVDMIMYEWQHDEWRKKWIGRGQMSTRWTSLVAHIVKHLPTMWESQVWSLGQEDPLEKEMATHSSTLAWKIPWIEEPGRL